MRVFGVAVIISLICCLQGQRGGLLVQVSQKGLDYVSNVALNSLFNETRSIKIQNFEHTDGPFDFELKNIVIKNLEAPEPSIELFKNNQTISWKVHRAFLAASFDWSWQYKTFITIGESGSVDLFFRSLSVDFNFQLDYDSVSGIPFIKPWRCRSELDDLELDFNGAWNSFVYNIIAYLAKSKIKSHILTTFNQAVINAIETNANDELKTMDVNPSVFDGLKIEFNLIENPKICEHSIEFLLSGCVYNPTKRSCPTNYVLQNLMDRRVQNRMLAFSVSELSLNQILKVQYERGDFHKTISKNDLDDEDKKLFLLTCPSGFCIGNFFPNMGGDDQNSEFELHFIPSSSPTVEISPTKSIGKIQAILKISSKDPRAQSLASLFAVKTSITLMLHMQVEDSALKVKVTSFTPEFDLSSLPASEDLKNNLNYIGNIFGQSLVEKFNAQGAIGYPLVKTQHIDLKNTLLSFEQSYVFFSTDFEYTAP